MQNGINHENSKKIAHGVSTLLADTYTLYLMTQNFHWNVTGPNFRQLHAMFEDHYVELAEAVDEIAERVRALGFKAPGTYKEFMKLTSIQEANSDLDATQMIKMLMEGHEIISRKSKEVIEVASNFQDEATIDLISSRMKAHEKTAWMLNSFLQ